MPFIPNILTTDWLVYLLVAGIVGFAVYASRHEHLRAPWRQVMRRPLAMSALIILSVYIAIGLLDSLHLRQRIDNPDSNSESVESRYSHEIVSALDLLVEPLRLQVEKTYSAPFATHAYTKESITSGDSSSARVYPRLLYGGAHLTDPDDRMIDILERIGVALLEAVVVWWALVMSIIFLIERKGRKAFRQVAAQLLDGSGSFPWRAVLLTLAVVVFVFCLLLNLVGYYHLFGTDQVGNDVFYKSLKSIRTGLLIGTLTTLVMLPFAIVLGMMAGYFRGWVDDIIQYLYTTLSSIPGVLLIAAAILSLQVYMANNSEQFLTVTERSDTRLLFLCIILGITSWTSLCRLLRAETLKLREIDYVQAANALGVSHIRIMTRHLFPNLMHIVLITIVLQFSGLVLAEAVLSYIGVGVDPIMDSWGNMINSARLEMAREPMVWWSLSAAFVFMFGLVLSANLFSDAVRDAFDPRLRIR